MYKRQPVVSRGVFLGGLMKNYKNSIAVSGSHGKSTTTSMISKILMNSTKNPTILLGGDLDEIEGNVHVGDKEMCIRDRNISIHFQVNIYVI